MYPPVNSLKTILVMAALSLAGCAGNLYEYNLKHAYVAPAAQLSSEETEQVIYAVTTKSLRMIISVTRSTSPDEVVVDTDNGEEGLMVYRLKKNESGRWHIVSYGPGRGAPD
jgi:hypothetical protein